MNKNIVFVIFCILFISCGNIEENNLISESQKNENFRITTTEKDLDENNHLHLERKQFKVFDKYNRIINIDNNSFLFYDQNNKLINIKSVYKREGKGLAKVINEKRIYDLNGNLRFILDENDTTSYFTYNRDKKLIKEIYPRQEIFYEYKNNLISKKTIIEDGDTLEVHNYAYDKSKKLNTDVYVFSKKNKMKVFYKYYSNNKLFSKRDSSYSKTNDPNEYIEFLTEYYYDKNDSVVEIRKSGRILSEKVFKLRGKTKFEYLTNRPK
ncbi:hypothetical protein SAMN05444671_3418 [Flavobacterium sp. CF108]|uniref:hypothetical protein n=1 Tax=unclassified Flavobacterium TaxID=196869 RepID=UPI0008C19F56|nr:MULTISPECIES: hypothetical protein [unclassified Flavobacterium]SEO42858.1 hypothetical protein SAMN04487978_2852 [Flavobacterium sp. fv08]SHH68352.1 hypothetical protein SAMN05444671_3418 [Flavobacterium sp. CF108]